MIPTIKHTINSKSIDLSDVSSAYRIRFKTFLGSKQIRFGEWGNDSHVRLFNRKTIQWNNENVHEQLIIPANTITKKLDGYILHYTMKDVAEYATKMTQYALLNAEKYFEQQKKASWLKRNISPSFSFIQNYILRGGFLDGREGYLIARVTAFYTLLKYARLYELYKSVRK